jgi:hypothetical protein
MPFPSDTYESTRHRYGLQLLAYVIHNIIELHIPQLKLSGSLLSLFAYQVGQPTINGLKRRAAELYHIKIHMKRSNTRYCMASLYMLTKLT